MTPYILARQALTIRKKVLGDEHPDTATSLNNLEAICSRSQGDYASGSFLSRTSAEDPYKKSSGDWNIPDTVISLNQLGFLLDGSKRLRGGRAHTTNKSLKIRKKVLGDEHPRL